MQGNHTRVATALLENYHTLAPNGLKVTGTARRGEANGMRPHTPDLGKDRRHAGLGVKGGGTEVTSARKGFSGFDSRPLIPTSIVDVTLCFLR